MMVGPHRFRVDGDVIEVTMHGEVAVDDIKALQALVIEVLAARGRCYALADLAQMHGLSATARRQVAMWGQGEAERLTASVVIGSGFAMRTLITLTLNAIRLLSRAPVEVAFVSDESAGRAWIAAHRAKLDAQRAPQASR